MKRTHVIIGLLFFAMFTMFMECGDEAVGPSLSIYGGDFIDSDETVEPGAILAFSWHAQKGDAKLETMTIARDDQALVGWDDKEIPNAQNENYTDTALLEAPLNEGAYNYTLIVTDKDGLSASQSVVITVDPALAGNPIHTYTAILMAGLENNEYGSFLDAETGTVYKYDGATSNPGLIDMVYYYGSQNNATFCAPSDPTVNGGAGNFSTCVSWSTKNTTLFGSSNITASEFDNIVSDVEISVITGLSETKKTDLAVGHVASFETVGGKKGLVKVTACDYSNTGTITIDVKIQQ
ncbi:MAG: hypothetical protein JSV22_07180 [Bacteroidales bacterium]|nr:MAG: hypothetical protein JSV22_07180 [Bacteroidales bacterium]